jgi:hypothetical protein
MCKPEAKARIDSSALKTRDLWKNWAPQRPGYRQKPGLTIVSGRFLPEASDIFWQTEGFCRILAGTWPILRPVEGV